VNVIEPLTGGPPGPEVWERPEMRAVLAVRDFGRVFRLLQRIGYSQKRIGALTGQSQSEVCAIIHGRKVVAWDVIERIVRKLQIPPHLAGLACGSCNTAAGTQPDDATPAIAGCVRHFKDDRLLDDMRGLEGLPVVVRTMQEAEAVVDSQGRVRLPDAVRELAGLGPGDRVAIVVRADGRIRLTKASDLLGPIIGSAPGLTAAANLDDGTGDGWAG